MRYRDNGCYRVWAAHEVTDKEVMISIRQGKDNRRFIEITDRDPENAGQPNIAIMIWDSGAGVMSIRCRQSLAMCLKPPSAEK